MYRSAVIALLTGIALGSTPGCVLAAEASNADLVARIESLEKELAALKALVTKPAAQAVQAVAPPASPPVSAPTPLTTRDSKFRLSGYVQMRAFDAQTTTNAPKVRDEFDLRRAQMIFTGDIGRRALGRFSFDMGRTQFSTRDAFLEYRASRALLLRAGQFKLPVSYEVLQSAADLPALERALINQRLYPGNRDRGFMADWNLSRRGNHPVWVQLGVVNGTGPNQSDNNEGKELFGGLFFKRQRFDARLAYNTGSFVFDPDGAPPPFRTRKYRASLSLHGILGDAGLWNWSGQYTRGRGDFPLGGGAPRLTGTVGPAGAFNPAEAGGYYLLLVRRLHKNSPLSLWAKHDAFDPNREVGGDNIKITGAGVLWDVDSHVGLSGGLFHKNYPGVEQNNTVGLQTQLRF